MRWYSTLVSSRATPRTSSRPSSPHSRALLGWSVCSFCSCLLLDTSQARLSSVRPLLSSRGTGRLIVEGPHHTRPAVDLLAGGGAGRCYNLHRQLTHCPHSRSRSRSLAHLLLLYSSSASLSRSLAQHAPRHQQEAASTLRASQGGRLPPDGAMCVCVSFRGCRGRADLCRLAGLMYVSRSTHTYPCTLSSRF